MSVYLFTLDDKRGIFSDWNEVHFFQSYFLDGFGIGLNVADTGYNMGPLTTLMIQEVKHIARQLVAAMEGIEATADIRKLRTQLFVMQCQQM